VPRSNRLSIASGAISLNQHPLWLAIRITFACSFQHQGETAKVEVTKALAALQPLYGKDNVEIVTLDGQRVRGTVRSMKTTQALTTPSVKIECASGEIVKIPFPSIAEIKDHNPVEEKAEGSRH
jgi:hypothetical protein